MADLIHKESGRTTLKLLWEEYAGLSRKYHLPFMAATLTRRANQERVHTPREVVVEPT